MSSSSLNPFPSTDAILFLERELEITHMGSDMEANVNGMVHYGTLCYENEVSRL